MEIQGKIKLIKEVQEISPTFKKRELILTTDEQYPQTLSVEFIQDKTDLLNNFEVNQSVKVGINLRGREWENPETKELKYFNSIQGWRIDQLDQGADNDESIPTQKPFETTDLDANQNDNEEEDDLPF